jgi:hypothetical protein
MMHLHGVSRIMSAVDNIAIDACHLGSDMADAVEISSMKSVELVEY